MSEFLEAGTKAIVITELTESGDSWHGYKRGTVVEATDQRGSLTGGQVFKSVENGLLQVLSPLDYKVIQ